MIVEGGRRIVPIPFRQLDRAIVCQPTPPALSTGERVQLKANSRTEEVRRLRTTNSSLVTVKEMFPDGRIALSDGRMLPADYRQFTMAMR